MASELDMLERAHRENPGSTVFIALAQAYLDGGRAKEAVALLEKGVRAHPANGAAHLALGRAYGAIGRWTEAERELARASALLAGGVPMPIESVESSGAPGSGGTAVDEFAGEHDTDPNLAALADVTQETEIDDLPTGLKTTLPATVPLALPLDDFSTNKARAVEPTITRTLEENVVPTTLDAYLNNLLGARGHEGEDDPAPEPGARWGHKLVHPFALLWFFLAMGAIGVGGWVWWDARERAADVAERLAKVHVELAKGSPADLANAVEHATSAVERDPGSAEALAALAAARTLALHLHGQGHLQEAGATVVAARQKMKTTEASPEGHRDLAVAEAALALGTLDRGLDVRGDLETIKIILDREVERHADDALLVWLDGQVAAATGDRTRARAVLSRVADVLPAASLALAELDLDDGDLAAAAARLDRLPDLPMAQAEARLARAITGSGSLAPAAAPPAAPSAGAGVRVAAWGHLAEFYDARAHGDRARALDALRTAAVASTEARFVAWLALAEIDAGRPGDAAAVRARLRTAGATPVAAVVDGELALVDGKPAESIALSVHPRSRRNHGRALIADGKLPQAAAELDTVNDPETHAWAELAHYLGTPAPRSRPPTALISVPSTAPLAAEAHYLAGEAWLAAGENSRAQEGFAAAATAGGTHGYRAQTRVAEAQLAAGKPADAEANARAAIAVAPTYPAAHAVLGRALLARGAAAMTEAGAELQIVVDAGRATADDELAYAECALALGHADLAKDAVKRAKTKGASNEGMAGIAAKIDPAFPAELGLPGAAAPPPAVKKGKR